LAGQIITVVKDACLQSFIGARPHLVEPVYECNLQTHEEYYGGVHSSLARRKAKILSEDLHESSNLFLIKAQLPVQEVSFIAKIVLRILQLDVDDDTGTS
jgi:translation elongation factor EF-G